MQMKKSDHKQWFDRLTTNGVEEPSSIASITIPRNKKGPSFRGRTGLFVCVVIGLADFDCGFHPLDGLFQLL
jgi:hypothetical protein